MMIVKRPLRRLQALRVLHVYDVAMDHTDCPSCQDDPEVRFDALQFAKFFFQEMHLACPDLEVLILGLCGGYSEKEAISHLANADDDAKEEDIANGRYPQCILIKQIEITEIGRVQIQAKRTSRKRLQDDFPDLDIIAHDPGLENLERYIDLRYQQP